MFTVKVTIIIPVYNAERFLEECINSVVEQDIGFENTIELILVDDGSTDSSGEICARYADLYPHDVVHIKQVNAGASEARNAGVAAARGELIGFIDADDYISPDVVRSVLGYFQSAPADVALATIRVVQFGSKNKERPINKKFDGGTRTVDLLQPEWHYVNPRVAPAFIRAPAARNHRFHRDIRFYEDTRYVTEVMSESMKMGIVDKGIYFNRMHEADDVDASITTGATNERRFYMDSPENVSLHLLEKYKGKALHPPDYYQFLAMYEMRWRMFYNPHRPGEVLNEQDLSRYREVNRRILSLLSDETIVANELLNVRQRTYLLSLKHSKDILDEAELGEDDRLYWQGHLIFNHMTRMTVKLLEVIATDSELRLKGRFVGFFVDDFNVYPRQDGRIVADALSLHDDGLSMAVDDDWDDDRYKTVSFELLLPVPDRGASVIDFQFSLKGHHYPVKYLNRSLVFGGQSKPPRFSVAGNYWIAWYGDKLKVAPASNSLTRAVLKLDVTVVRVFDFGVRGLKKVKRKCIQMIKTLR